MLDRETRADGGGKSRRSVVGQKGGGRRSARAGAESGSPSAPSRTDAILGLQRQLGNAAVGRLARGSRAVEVARVPAGPGSRLSDRASSSPARGDSLGSRIQRAQGGGTSLPETVRERLETGVGGGLAGVKVHTGPAADHLSRDVGAMAFTTGRDIFFRSGAYAPESPKGFELLAHEATHVVQQSRGPVAGTPVGGAGGVSVSDPSDSFERAAGETARRVARGVPARGGSVQDVAANGGETSVQRYAATALSAPSPWISETASVFRPGEGVSGGVFILTSAGKTPPISRVVVKPVYGETGLGLKEAGEQLVMGDRALARFLGVSTPASRVVNAGSPEFAELLKVISPYAPKKPTTPGPELDGWKDVKSAQSFVVMAEVPKAKSVASMAKDAATSTRDPTGVALDLVELLFASDLVTSLARMAVGDILIGNIDRITTGANNLGNIMISQVNGKAKAHAIDTTAYIGKEVDPATILNKGNSMARSAWQAVKEQMDDPAVIIRDFYGALVHIMKGATDPSVVSGHGSPPAWEIVTNTFMMEEERIVGIFMQAFRTALADVGALIGSAAGRKLMRETVEQFKGTPGEAELSHATLKANAMYLAARVGYVNDPNLSDKSNLEQSHAEAGTDAAAYLAYRQLTTKDMDSLVPPQDAASLSQAPAISPNMKTAQVEALTTLPKPARLTHLTKGRKRRTLEPDVYNSIEQKVNETLQNVQAMGTKRTIGGKDVPRDRVAAGEFLAKTHLTAIGSARATVNLSTLAECAARAEMALNGHLRPVQVQKLRPAVVKIGSVSQALDFNVRAYVARLRQLAAGVRSIKRYADRHALADALDAVAQTMEESAQTSMTAIAKLSPSRMEAKIASQVPAQN